MSAVVSILGSAFEDATDNNRVIMVLKGISAAALFLTFIVLQNGSAV